VLNSASNSIAIARVTRRKRWILELQSDERGVGAELEVIVVVVLGGNLEEY
jgi:hypothetical protein